MHSGQTQLAGVIGWPVTHSKSPRLQGFWLEKYGIDGAYVPLAVEPENFEKAVLGLQASGFKGVNVTVPHKENALAVANLHTQRAQKIGAANTLIFQDDGQILADNTDGYGFIENLCQGAPNWVATSGPALVLGAGGASRAILVALVEAGVPEIYLTNRTRARADQLAETIEGPIKVIDWSKRESSLGDLNLLTNTTTLGMVKQLPLEMDLSILSSHTLVNDIVYAPLMTDLLNQAKSKGCQIVDGIGMLLHQARPGFKAWFGKDPEVTEELRTFVLED